MLAVAHFHGLLFVPTETFIYQYLTAFRRIVPVALTFKIINRNQFPYQQPLIELYSWNSWSRLLRWLYRRAGKSPRDLTVDQPQTYTILQKISD